MIYKDPIYGFWEVPDFIECFLHTKEMERLRRISQVVLPNSILPIGTIPNRFLHGLGVCRLAMLVREKNQQFTQCEKILPIAALLHDMGNCCLSHLGEYFLREMYGHDGETFLEVILRDSETEKILKKMGYDISQVIRLVAGKLSPFSDILNGSMDIDNLDNVGRYAKFANLDVKFDAMLLAQSFRFVNSEWVLPISVFDEAMRWKKARKIVYKDIYSDPEIIPENS